MLGSQYLPARGEYWLRNGAASDKRDASRWADVVEISCPLRCVWKKQVLAVIDKWNIFPAKFLRPKEEQLVLLNRAADDISKIVLVVISLRLPRQVKVIVGIESGVANELESFPVEL